MALCIENSNKLVVVWWTLRYIVHRHFEDSRNISQIFCNNSQVHCVKKDHVNPAAKFLYQVGQRLRCSVEQTHSVVSRRTNDISYHECESIKHGLFQAILMATSTAL